MAVLSNMVMVRTGFRCGIDMDGRVGKIFQVVKKFVPVLLGYCMPALHGHG